MIRFLLNDFEVTTELPAGTLILDYVRYHKNLTGTKIGCREGDCGACTVLVGEMVNGNLKYRSATSCLMAIGNANGKHIVTIEGINVEGLNAIQNAMSEEGATQCGFCTPGFVVSLAGFCISESKPDYKNAIAAIDGNICRCTGYKSIERAVDKLSIILADKKDKDAIAFAIKNNIIPAYFSQIKEKLQALALQLNGALTNSQNGKKVLGGGTDLYVQQHDKMTNADIQFLFDHGDLNGIVQEGARCILGASTTVTDLVESEIFKEHFGRLEQFVKLVSSTQIRNMATVAGNIINASPIGDLTIFFLALDAQIVLSDGTNAREIPLRKLYKGYKKLDKREEEFVVRIWFELPEKKSLFNFEKVSKRTHLDIASVNSAASFKMDGEVIGEASISAGGVGPIPMYLQKASGYMAGKKVTESLIDEVIGIAQSEVSPISDARGTETYKRLLLGQLIRAHFITLFASEEVGI